MIFPPKSIRWRLALLLMVLLVWASPRVAANEVQSRLEADYVGKYLLIRNFYGGKELRYDAAGTLVHGGDPEPWTIAEVQVASLKLHHGRLEIEGKRAALAYDANKRDFDHVYRTHPQNKKQEVDTVKLELEVPSDSDEAALRQALEKVFVLDRSKLPELVPEYWRDFLLHPQGPSAGTEPPLGEKVYRVGEGGVKPPKPVFTPDPEYSEAARQAKYQGTTVLRLVVEPDGKTNHISIVRPLGMGLDDQAVKAVSGWKLRPAELDGKPVPVLINVEVNFRLY